MTFTNPVDYSAAWSIQQQFHAERLVGSRPDTLMLLQHFPVYTTGRRTRPIHLHPEVASCDLGVPVVTVNRGGSVTYHGPGQLVAYPILALSGYARGAKAYVHMLEEVVIRTLQAWDIHGYRVEGAAGIWGRDRQGQAKVASIGARIDRGITLHGVALNVTNDLVPFSRIVPCGLEGCRMTSMAQITQTPVSVHVVAEELANTFSIVFHVEWIHQASQIEAQRVVDTRKER